MASAAVRFQIMVGVFLVVVATITSQVMGGSGGGFSTVGHRGFHSLTDGATVSIFGPPVANEDDGTVDLIARLSSVNRGAPVLLTVTYDGSAEEGIHFTGPASIEFAPDQWQATLTLSLIDDGMFGEDTTLTITLEGADKVQPSHDATHEMTIREAEPLPVSTIAGPPTLFVFQESTTVTVRLLTSPTDLAITVPFSYSTTDPSAGDSLGEMPPLVFPPGVTEKEIVVTLNDMHPTSRTMTFQLEAAAKSQPGSPATHTLHILEEAQIHQPAPDAPPRRRLQLAVETKFMVAEGEPGALVHLRWADRLGEGGSTYTVQRKPRFAVEFDSVGTVTGNQLLTDWVPNNRTYIYRVLSGNAMSQPVEVPVHFRVPGGGEP